MKKQFNFLIQDIIQDNVVRMGGAIEYIITDPQYRVLVEILVNKRTIIIIPNREERVSGPS